MVPVLPAENINLHVSIGGFGTLEGNESLFAIQSEGLTTRVVSPVSLHLSSVWTLTVVSGILAAVTTLTASLRHVNLLE